MKNDFMPIDGKFKLQTLPFGIDDLKVVSAGTLSLHHGKHLKAYVDNLNKLIVGSGFESKCLFDIVSSSEGALFNNAGQVLNHMLYFEQFIPNGVSMGADMKKLIVRDFGSVESFVEEFEIKGASLFGSGWVWLAQDHDGKLIVTQESNAGNPITRNLKPLMTFDVWEHAYYLDYQNRRSEYLSSLWKVLDWSVIENRLRS